MENILISSLQMLKDDVLRDKKYSSKIGTLLSTWQRLSELPNNSLLLDKLDFNILFRSSSILFISFQWSKLPAFTRNYLKETLKKMAMSLKGSISSYCCILQKTAEIPWDIPILRQLLKGKYSKLEMKDLKDFFEKEGDSSLVNRLIIFLLNKRDQFISHIGHAFLSVYGDADIGKIYKDDEIEFILELYFSTLFPNKKAFVKELANCDMNWAYMFLKRKSEKVLNQFKNLCLGSDIWNRNGEVIECIANVIITRFIRNDCIPEHLNLIEQIIEVWVIVTKELNHSSNVENVVVLDRIVQNLEKLSESSVHVYNLAKYLKIHMFHFGNRYKRLCIEVCMRAIIMNLNEMVAYDTYNLLDKKFDSQQCLSKGLMSLADIFREEHMIAYRECVLTSFSVFPTEETLETIRTLEWTTSLLNYKEPQKPACELIYGKILWDEHTEKKLDTPFISDLTTVLAAPRSLYLSWVLSYEELVSRCVKYMNRFPESLERKKLNYLNIHNEIYFNLSRKSKTDDLENFSPNDDESDIYGETVKYIQNETLKIPNQNLKSPSQFQLHNRKRRVALSTSYISVSFKRLKKT